MKSKKAKKFRIGPEARPEDHLTHTHPFRQRPPGEEPQKKESDDQKSGE